MKRMKTLIKNILLAVPVILSASCQSIFRGLGAERLCNGL